MIMMYNKKFSNEYLENLLVEKEKILKPELLKLLTNLNGKKVVDLGCGNGYYSRMFAAKGAHVTAVDKNFNQLKNAIKIEKASPLGISYMRSPIEHAKLTDNSFDIALMIFVICETRKKSEVKKMIRKAHSLLKTDGILVISQTHPHNINRKNAIACVFTKHKNYFGDSVKGKSVVTLMNGKTMTFKKDFHYTLQFIINMLADSGFYITKFIEPEYKVPYPTHMIIVAKKV